MIAGRSASARIDAPRSASSATGPSSRSGTGDLGLGLHEHDVERVVDERRPAPGARPRRRSALAVAAGIAVVSPAVSAVFVSGATNGKWSTSWRLPEPHASRARARQARRAGSVLLRAGDRAHPVGDAGAGGQRANAGTWVAFAHPSAARRRLLVPVSTTSIPSSLQPSYMESRWPPRGEQLGDAARHQRAGHEPPAVNLTLGRVRRRLGCLLGAFAIATAGLPQIRRSSSRPRRCWCDRAVRRARKRVERLGVTVSRLARDLVGTVGAYRVTGSSIPFSLIPGRSWSPKSDRSRSAVAAVMRTSSPIWRVAFSFARRH